MSQPNRFAVLCFSEPPMTPGVANDINKSDTWSAKTLRTVRDAVKATALSLAEAGTIDPSWALYCNEHGHDHIRATEADTAELIEAVKAGTAKQDDVVAAIEKLSARAMAVEADLATACDAAVHGHHFCSPGRKAHEHISTLLQDHKEHQRKHAVMVKTLKRIHQIDPKSIAAAHASIALDAVEAD